MDARYKNQSLTRTITLSAFAIGISMISLLLFRGVTSLFAAISIPLTVYLLLYRHSKKYYVLTALAIIILTFMFFTTQTIFVIMYMVLAVALKILNSKRLKQFKIISLNFLMYIGLLMISLFTGIYLTELVFGIPLHQMMEKISRGSTLAYLLVLLLESVIVALVHYPLSKAIVRRT